jgi:hypothetical protein
VANEWIKSGKIFRLSAVIGILIIKTILKRKEISYSFDAKMLIIYNQLRKDGFFFNAKCIVQKCIV